jgi:hypothetical protein
MLPTQQIVSLVTASSNGNKKAVFINSSIASILFGKSLKPSTSILTMTEIKKRVLKIYSKKSLPFFGKRAAM